MKPDLRLGCGPYIPAAGVRVIYASIEVLLASTDVA